MSEIEHTPALARGRPRFRVVAPRLTAEGASSAIAVAALAAIVIATALVVIAAAAAPSFLVPASQASFPGWIAGPLHGIGGRGALTQHDFAALMIAMFACYLVALALARSLSIWVLAGTVALLHVLLALSPPLNLTDLFNYIGFARLGAVHHMNPYAHGVIAVPGDPVVAFDSWRHLHSPYGPLFTLLSYAVAPLGVAASLWILKVGAALCSLACIALLAACARRLALDARPAVALMGLNPLVLVFGVGGGHNDFLMLALVLAAIALTLRAREPAGVVSTVVAAGFKASAAILLPFQLIAAERRRRALVAGAIAVAAVVAVSLAVFGTSVVAGVQSQAQCVSKLSLPDTFGRLIGAGGAVPAVHLTLLAGFVAVFVWQLVRARRGRWIAPAGWAMLALIASLSWLMPWYVAWVLPLAALGGSRRLKLAVIVASAYSLVVWLPPLASAVTHALPRPTPHLAGGCTRGPQQIERHRGWVTGFR